MNRLRREYASPAGGFFGEIFLSIYFSWINLTPFSHRFHRMFTVFPDTGVQKMQENDVQEVKMQGKFNKKKIIRIAVIAGVVVIVLAGGGTVIAGKVKNRTATESVADTNRSSADRCAAF